MRNLSYNAYKKQNKVVRIDHEEAATILADEDHLVEKQLIRFERSREIANLLSELRESYADIISLRYFHELTVEEIEELKDLNEAFLKDIGYEHMNAVCEEADSVMEKYADLEVPKSLDDWFYGYLEEQKQEARQAQRKKSIISTSKRAAAIIVIVSAVMSIAAFSVDAFRVRFFNLILETREKFGLVSYEESHIEQQLLTPDDWIGYYPTFLPEGYSLLEHQTGNSISRLTYIHDDGNTIELLQGSMVSSSQIGTENAQIMEIDINGTEGILIEKDDETIFGWSQNNSSLILRGNLDKSTLLKVAESISEK